MRRIRPYGHMRPKSMFLPILGGLGIFPYFIPYIRVRGFPLNGIFYPCACLLAGGCGPWRLLARRRRRRWRHSVPAPLGGHTN